MINLSILSENLNNTVPYKTFFSAFGYKEDDSIFFRTFYDPEKKDDAQNRDITKWNVDNIMNHLHQRNDEKYGVFFVVNGGGHTDAKVKTARAHFIDIDDLSFTDQINALNAFPLEPSIIIKTSRSLHCYWLIDNGDIKDFERIQMKLIQHFHADRKIKNPSRVMRLYGFYHHKHEPVLVTLIKFNPEIRYTQQQLEAVLPEVEGYTPEVSTVPMTGENMVLPGDGDVAFLERNKSARWVLKWMKKCCIQILQIKVVENKLIFAVECPWKDQHTHDTGICQSGIVVRISGEICYVCQHDHCADKSWKDYRAFYEPKNLEPKTETVFLPKKLSEVTERKVDWLVEGYIPRNGITILAADGGAGKTSTECALAAAVTSGKRPFMLGDVPKQFETKYAEPAEVLFLSGEDYAEFTLCQKIRSMGGDLTKVSIVDPSDTILEKCKIGTDYLHNVIDAIRPDLVIIDPLQAFIDRNVNMGMRNQMRQSLQPINELASKYGFAVVIAVHSNKRDAVSGRNRVSDSSDIWDMARSVLMVGMADPDTKQRYLSHEKSNWSKLSQTVLFDIVADGCVAFAGCTEKKDADFQREASQARNIKKEVPKTEEVKDFIMEVLSSGAMAAGDLQKAITDNGWSNATFRRARTELKDTKRITSYRTSLGQGKGTTIYWKLSNKIAVL